MPLATLKYILTTKKFETVVFLKEKKKKRLGCIHKYKHIPNSDF